MPWLAAARMAQSLLISSWRAELHPDNIDYIMADAEDCLATLIRIERARSSGACSGARGRLRRAAARAHATLAETMALRRARLGPALSLSYDEPVRLGLRQRRLADGRRRQSAPRRLQQRAAGRPRPSSRDSCALRPGPALDHQHPLPRGRGGRLRRPSVGAHAGRALGGDVRQLGQRGERRRHPDRARGHRKPRGRDHRARVPRHDGGNGGALARGAR